MTDIEQQRRERAYHIWEREGRPEGRQIEHWRMADEDGGRTEEQASEITEANQDASDEFNGENGREE
jgi:hypothetical protein